MRLPDGLPFLVVEGEGQRTAAGALKFPYIDCLRGYAILLVIMCHTSYALPDLPYPVHLLAAAGWYGVELFFLASSLTLMMSADNERSRTGRVDFLSFFLRRFLRIAPMYYLAAAFYCVAMPPAAFDLLQPITSILFLNAWHPATMTTVPGAWQVVPGGWSIGVEFTFYLLFPALVSVVTTLARAVVLVLGTIVVGILLNSALFEPLTQRFGFAAADNFLYFWFFNQAPIFALGTVTFFVLKGLNLGRGSALVERFQAHSGLLALSAIAVFAAVAWTPRFFLHQLQLRPALPQYLAVAIAFMAFIIAVASSRSRLLVNKVIGNIGTVSFSAYLLHFAVIGLVIERHPDVFNLRAIGWSAIATFCLCYLVVTTMTLFCSAITYRLVEAPMIVLAKHLTRTKLKLPAQDSMIQN